MVSPSQTLATSATKSAKETSQLVQTFTVKPAPSTSKAALIVPPPCINKLFISPPVVEPSTTVLKSKVLGLYTKV